MQSVTLFGVVLPLLGCITLFGIVLFVKNNQLGDFEQKKVLYNQGQQQMLQAQALKNQIGDELAHLTTWQDLLDKQSSQTAVVGALESAISTTKTGTLLLNSQSKSSNVRGFSEKVQGTTASYDLSLTGTYSEAQEALLKLERKLPHLFLNNLSIRPQANGKFVELNLTYSIWESTK